MILDTSIKNDIYDFINKTAFILYLLRKKLRDVDFDEDLRQVADNIPLLLDKLESIILTSDDAVVNVLSSIELLKSCQCELENKAKKLILNWDEWMMNVFSKDQEYNLILDTSEFLTTVQEETNFTRQHLHNIMLAQGFYDKNEQSIRRMNSLLTEIEFHFNKQLIDDSLFLKAEHTEKKSIEQRAIFFGGKQSDVDDIFSSNES